MAKTIPSVEVERVESDGEKTLILISVTPAALGRAIGRSDLPLDFRNNPYRKMEILHRIYLICETEVRRLEAIEKMKNDPSTRIR